MNPWSGLGAEWEYSPPELDKDYSEWALRCQFFKAFLSERQSGKWCLALHTDTEEIRFMSLKARTEDVAKQEAQVAVQLFIKEGLAELKAPSDEVRFVQIAITGHQVYGLTIDGVVWQWDDRDSTWSPLPMEVYQDEKK